MTPPPEPIVHIVDDDEPVRDSLSLLFYSVGLETKTYASAADFLARCDFGRPGCLILDIRMPGMSGLDLQKELIKRKIYLPIIILTGHGEIPMAVTALKLGASDFLEKPYNDQRLIDSVQYAIDQGNRERNVREAMAQSRACFKQLSKRERDVMKLVVAGEPNKVIAAHLGISPRTVEIHRHNVMEKFRSRSLSDLVRKTLLLGVDADVEE
ncbi:MAG: response regulator transcription factor [Alphaproteobacteria bacterium]|nr:response regulator transcription factor [Alphaproteobacteria bacterium]